MTRLLRSNNATEAAVRETAEKFRWMHFATHGYFAPLELKHSLAREPAGQSALQANEELSWAGVLSGLAMAGANCTELKDGEDDGILTAEEVAAMDFRGGGNGSALGL